MPNGFPVTLEQLFGINIGYCLQEDIRFVRNLSACESFRSILLLNLGFRLNFYFMKRQSFLTKHIQIEKLPRAVCSLLFGYGKVALPLTLLTYVFLTLKAGVSHVVMSLGLNFVMLLFAWIIYARATTKENSYYYLRQKIVFNFFVHYHFLVVLADTFSSLASMF